MIFDLYHDECKEGGYWHGFFFVPCDTREYLLSLLHAARVNTEHCEPLHYVNIGRRAKDGHRARLLTEAWTTIGVAALQQRKFAQNRPQVNLGRSARRRTNADMRALDSLIRCKFVLFRERDKHQKMYESMDGLTRIETTFRMAIKGGIHKLFSSQEPIQIKNVFMDGGDHYTGIYGRSFDINRTLRRLAYESRPFVTFVAEPRLIAQRSDHRRIEPHQQVEDSHLLQLCDALIGGFRFHACDGNRNHPRFLTSFPCLELLGHDQANKARMNNSRYRNGFSLDEAWIENDEWNFAPMNPVRLPMPEQHAMFKSQSA